MKNLCAYRMWLAKEAALPGWYWQSQKPLQLWSSKTPLMPGEPSSLWLTKSSRMCRCFWSGRQRAFSMQRLHRHRQRRSASRPRIGTLKSLEVRAGHFQMDRIEA